MPRYAFIRYIGAKHRISKAIAERLRSTGKTCLIEVFGGSAAVMLNAGFEKRVYNDLDGDLVNLFRVMADRSTRAQLLYKLKWSPLAREIFDNDTRTYMHGGYSFKSIAQPVDRARATFYRQALAFGGKMRSGGFQCSPTGRRQIKEIGKYRDNLKKFNVFGEFFRGTIIEHQNYGDCIAMYGKQKDAVLFIDPPYPELENYYYSIPFNNVDQAFLAHQLVHVPAPAVCTFYESPMVRELYPEKYWKYEFIKNTKNNQSTIYGHKKRVSQELILTKI